MNDWVHCLNFYIKNIYCQRNIVKLRVSQVKPNRNGYLRRQILLQKDLWYTMWGLTANKIKHFIIVENATLKYESFQLRTGAGDKKLSSGLRSGVSSLLAVKDSMPLSLCSGSSIVKSTIMILHALIQVSLFINLLIQSLTSTFFI